MHARPKMIMDYLHLLRKVFKGLGEPITTCVHAIITYIYAYMCIREGPITRGLGKSHFNDMNGEHNEIENLRSKGS